MYCFPLDYTRQVHVSQDHWFPKLNFHIAILYTHVCVRNSGVIVGFLR